MGFKDNKTSENSQQILPFPPKKQPSQLPIYAGDENARLFYQKYYPMVKGVCMRIIRNKEDAEDMAHDVFAYVLEKFRKDGQSSIPYPKTYLSKAAANMGINKKKSKKGIDWKALASLTNL
jgi:DNA-directed RNA polymerase specialized sigma24 family protein